MGQLGDQPMEMQYEIDLEVAWRSRTTGKVATCVIRFRVLPPNRGIPSKNILLSAATLKALRISSLGEGHWIGKLGIDAPRAEEVLGKPGFEVANLLEEHVIHAAETCIIEPFESLPIPVQNSKELSLR